MALNQQQRNHAITMVQEAIAAKKKLISKKPDTELQFILNYINKSQITGITTEAIIASIVADRWGGYSASLLKALDLEQAFKDHQENTKQFNDAVCAKLVDLEKRLTGEIMFGTNYSVVVQAMESIEKC